MSDASESSDSAEAPGLSSWLLSFLSVRRYEYEGQYAESDAEDTTGLNLALAQLERSAAHLITTGVLPDALAPSLQAFMPGDSMRAKVRELLSYQIVHHRLEFDVAEDVCSRLDGVDARVRMVTMLTIVLLGYNPPPTVIKYFQRATTLFLAGYEPETIIMCGAVLEASMASRFTDELLLAAGFSPLFKSGDFSVGQRLKYEQRNRVLSDAHRKLVGELISWRNDAVHVQLDMGPKALNALASLVLILPELLPGELPDA